MVYFYQEELITGEMEIISLNFRIKLILYLIKSWNLMIMVHQYIYIDELPLINETVFSIFLIV